MLSLYTWQSEMHKGNTVAGTHVMGQNEHQEKTVSLKAVHLAGLMIDNSFPL